jgi:hypothetical protein
VCSPWSPIQPTRSLSQLAAILINAFALLTGSISSSYGLHVMQLVTHPLPAACPTPSHGLPHTLRRCRTTCISSFYTVWWAHWRPCCAWCWPVGCQRVWLHQPEPGHAGHPGLHPTARGELHRLSTANSSRDMFQKSCYSAVYNSAVFMLAAWWFSMASSILARTALPGAAVYAVG